MLKTPTNPTSSRIVKAKELRTGKEKEQQHQKEKPQTNKKERKKKRWEGRQPGG